MATARRSSEIAALGRVEPYLRYEAGGVRLRTVPNCLSKTSTPFHLGQDMLLADLRKENKKLCVRRAVRHYIRSTANVLRKDESHLFISVVGPNKGKAVSNQTIARWLLEAIREAYVAAGREHPMTLYERYGCLNGII